ncbi:MAG: ABC transporter substrate-binding protein [Sulfuricella sp.]|nr:ABC transporter substrate-binding protein [Sulfuricella sp.]
MAIRPFLFDVRRAARLRWLVIAVLFVSFFPLSSSAAGRDIVIGQSIDLSGPQGDIGKDYLAGAKVYFDFVNANGGIYGRKIVHRVADNRGSAERSAQITADFLGRNRVDALFGYFGQGSVEGLLHGDEFRRSRLPLVAPLSGMSVEPGMENMFFIRPSYETEAKKLVGYFLAQGISKFTAVYAADAYGKASLAAVENELRSRHLSLKGKHVVGSDGAEVDAVARAINADKPQAIIVILETLPAAQFVKAYRKLDATAYILGLSLINNVTLFELAGQDAAGTMLTQVVPHPHNWNVPVVMEHDRIMKIYRDEAPSHLTMEGFIAAKLLVGALKAAGKDASPDSLAAALRETRKLDVGGYTLDFSTNKNRGSSYVDINIVTRKGGLMH